MADDADICLLSDASSPPIIYHIKDGKVIQFFEGDDIATNINNYF